MVKDTKERQGRPRTQRTTQDDHRYKGASRTTKDTTDHPGRSPIQRSAKDDQGHKGPPRTITDTKERQGRPTTQTTTKDDLQRPKSIVALVPRIASRSASLNPFEPST